MKNGKRRHTQKSRATLEPDSERNRGENKSLFLCCSFWMRSTEPNGIEVILPKSMRPEQAGNGEND